MDSLMAGVIAKPFCFNSFHSLYERSLNNDISKINLNYWIVDLGAMNHIKECFGSRDSCGGKKKVKNSTESVKLKGTCSMNKRKRRIKKEVRELAEQCNLLKLILDEGIIYNSDIAH